MDPLTIGWLGMIALFALIILKVPIGISMMVVGVVGFALQTNWTSAGTLLASEPSNLLASVDLATLPLFLLMGTFANAAGFSADIYAAAASFLGHRRGGLAYATIGGCAAFGAVCGSSTATAATFAKIALPEMLQRNYSPSFAAGAIAAGGTLKALIPPSLIMILYCIIAQTFIYDLFAAAIIPAIITIVLNLITVNIAVRLNPSAAPVSERQSWDERLAALKRATPALILMVAVFGGFGVCVRVATQAPAPWRAFRGIVRDRPSKRDALRHSDGRVDFHLLYYSGPSTGLAHQNRCFSRPIQNRNYRSDPFGLYHSGHGFRRAFGDVDYIAIRVADHHIARIRPAVVGSHHGDPDRAGNDPSALGNHCLSDPRHSADDFAEANLYRRNALSHRRFYTSRSACDVPRFSAVATAADLSLNFTSRDKIVNFN